VDCAQLPLILEKSVAEPDGSASRGAVYGGPPFRIQEFIRVVQMF